MAFKETVRSYTANLNPNTKQIGTISIMCDTARLIIGFVDPADTLPPNTYDGSSKLGCGFQPFASYPFYLELLRNGAPLSVSFKPEDTPQPTFVVIASK
jgi:hypothetical protein